MRGQSIITVKYLTVVLPAVVSSLTGGLDCCSQVLTLNNSQHYATLYREQLELSEIENNKNGNCTGHIEVVELIGVVNPIFMDLNNSLICLKKVSDLNDSRGLNFVKISCTASSEWPPHESMMVIFTVFGGVSLVSLCIVFFVYWLLPDFNNLHGKIVLCNVVSNFLLTSFLLLIFNFKLVNDYVCKLVGYISYYSSISMFLWMTIMSFDLCTTFVREEIPQQSNKKIRFIIYSVIGWGSGLVLVVFLFIFENFLPLDSDLNPGVGTGSCFISKQGNKILYLVHFPILVMMIINISFFIITIVFLIRTHKKIEGIRKSSR